MLRKEKRIKRIDLCFGRNTRLSISEHPDGRLRLHHARKGFAEILQNGQLKILTHTNLALKRPHHDMRRRKIAERGLPALSTVRHAARCIMKKYGPAFTRTQVSWVMYTISHEWTKQMYAAVAKINGMAHNIPTAVTPWLGIEGQEMGVIKTVARVGGRNRYTLTPAEIRRMHREWASSAPAASTKS